MGRINITNIASQEEYVYPADWIDVRNAGFGDIELLVSDEGFATVAFIVTSTGSYNVDWGDGGNNTYSSGLTAQHTYTVGTGQPCSIGYTTFKIRISGSLSSFKVTNHSLTSKTQNLFILAGSINSNTITDLSNAFSKASGTTPAYCKSMIYFKFISVSALGNLSSAFNSCRLLEAVDFCNMNLVTNANRMFYNALSLKYVKGINTPALIDAGYMFSSCTKLSSVDVGSMVSVTDASNMFHSCATIKNIDVSKMTKVTTTSYMFYGCSNLETLDASALTKVTNSSYMFYNCFRLRSATVSGFTLATIPNHMFYGCEMLRTVDISNMTSITRTDYMFSNCNSLEDINISNISPSASSAYMFEYCHSLKTINAANFGLNSTSINLDSGFARCEEIRNLNLPNAKLTKITATGLITGPSLNKLETLTFHPSSTFSGSAPQIDLSYNTLSATQLNAIFTSLPTLTAKTIKVTGCTGAATCTTSIATAKGWTVTTV